MDVSAFSVTDVVLVAKDGVEILVHDIRRFNTMGDTVKIRSGLYNTDVKLNRFYELRYKLGTVYETSFSDIHRQESVEVYPLDLVLEFHVPEMILIDIDTSVDNNLGDIDTSSVYFEYVFRKV
jgi:hypothetical protein